MSIKQQTSVLLRSILALVLVSGLLGMRLVNQVFAAKGAGIDQAEDGGLLLNGTSFPSTGVLDTFNRANGTLGSNWSGVTSSYAIVNNRLDINSAGDIYWAANYLGVDQEAFVKLTTIDPNAQEISLRLKAQSNSPNENAQIEVVYHLPSSTVQVRTYSLTQQGWVQEGNAISTTFANGDEFGARALANGDVQVYKNSALLGTRSVTSWPYFAHGGYIGLAHLNAGNAVLDDFGGGTMSGSPALTPSVPCTDPTTCDPVHSVQARWRCNVAECTSADWTGAVIPWPSWSAYQNNARSGDNSRSVYSLDNQSLYPYMGSWADGCEVTAVSGIVLIIEWQRGQNVWRETLIEPGQTHIIDLVAPEDGAMIEARDGSSTSFSVSLENCTPQNIFQPPTPTPSKTATPSATPTPSKSPTATSTPSSTPTATATATPSRTPTLAPNERGGDTTGVFRPSNGALYLKHKNESGFADVQINYGIGGDYPVVGDWDGDGDVTIGVYRNGYFYLRSSNTIGFADKVFPFGMPGDQPIAGDWDGDGVDTIGVYRNGTFMLRNSNDAGAPQMIFGLGVPGDVGIAGDWDGDGKDSTGVFRPSNGALYLKNKNETGFADVQINYGIGGDKPVTGDWNGDGTDTIGVYRNGQFYLRNSNTIGFADMVFALGIPGDHPIAGNWDGLP